MNPVGLLVIALAALVIVMGVKGTQGDVLAYFKPKATGKTGKAA